MTIKKLAAVLLMTAVIFGATSAFGADYKTTLTLTLKSGAAVANPVYDEVYTLTIPESMTITKTGWNSIGNMTVSYSGTNTGFDTSKKLVVTASSTNTFTLKADGVTDTISYFLATGENDTAATTTFEFTGAQINAGASQAIGVNVEDFSSKSNGTYTDEITYSVEVKSAATLLSLTVQDKVSQGGSNLTFYYVEGETWRQAITNHPTENTGWTILQDKYINYSTLGALREESGKMVGITGSNTTIDTVIDASKQWSVE